MPVGNPAIQRADLKIAGLLVLVTLMSAVVWMDPHVLGTYGDDGVYVTTAKAMAEGKGYRIISLPTEPLQTKYPILYPLALAFVWKLWPSFPANIAALKALGLVCASAAVGLAYLYLVRFGYFSRRAAAWAGAISATTPFYVSYGPMALSCPCFALLVIVALWRLDRLAEQYDVGWRSCLVTGLVLGLPFLTRSIGIVFAIPAIAAKWRRPRELAWVALGAALVTLPWVGWTVWVLGRASLDPMTKYQTDYLALSGNLNGGPNFSFWWSETTRPYIPAMLGQNIVYAIWSAGGFPLGGITRLLIYAPLLMLVFALAVLAWWRIVRGASGKPVLTWFLVAYAFTLCVWPWSSSRFYMPVLPLLTPFLLTASSAVVRFVVAPRHQVWATRIALAAALTLNVLTLAPWNSSSFFANSAEREEQVDSWPSIITAFDWLKANADPQDVVAAAPDSMVYLYTSLKAVQPFVYQPAALFYGAHTSATGTFDDFERSLRTYRPKFMLYHPKLIGGPDFVALIQAAQAKYPGWISPVYRGADPRVVVYELDWNRGP
jgi:hypothetical protein